MLTPIQAARMPAALRRAIYRANPSPRWDAEIRRLEADDVLHLAEHWNDPTRVTLTNADVTSRGVVRCASAEATLAEALDSTNPIRFIDGELTPGQEGRVAVGIDYFPHPAQFGTGEIRLLGVDVFFARDADGDGIEFFGQGDPDAVLRVRPVTASETWDLVPLGSERYLTLAELSLAKGLLSIDFSDEPVVFRPGLFNTRTWRHHIASILPQEIALLTYRPISLELYPMGDSAANAIDAAIYGGAALDHQSYFNQSFGGPAPPTAAPPGAMAGEFSAKTLWGAIPEFGAVEDNRAGTVFGWFGLSQRVPEPSGLTNLSNPRVPYVVWKVESYASPFQVVVDIDLGSVPAEGVGEWRAEYVEPAGTSISIVGKRGSDLAVIDPDVEDGEQFEEQEQTYRIEVTGTPGPGGWTTPALHKLGVEFFTTEAFPRQSFEWEGGETSVDPMSGEANVAEAPVVIGRAGHPVNPAGRDRVTRVASEHYPTDLELELWLRDGWGSTPLGYRINRYQVARRRPMAMGEQFVGVSRLDTLKIRVPRLVDIGGGVFERVPKEWIDTDIATVLRELLTDVINVPDRVLDLSALPAATGFLTSMRLESADPEEGKKVADQLAFLCGGALAWQDGLITYVDLFGAVAKFEPFAAKATAAVWTQEYDLVAPPEVDPGLEHRLPEVYTFYDPVEIGGTDFEGEVRTVNGDALTLLDKVHEEEREEIAEEIARWCNNGVDAGQALAEAIGWRISRAFGTGFRRMTAETVFPQPAVRLGDQVAVITDRWTDRIPQADGSGNDVGRPLRGRVAVPAIVIGKNDIGTRWTLWVRDPQDIVHVLQVSGSRNQIPPLAPPPAIEARAQLNSNRDAADLFVTLSTVISERGRLHVKLSDSAAAPVWSLVVDNGDSAPRHVDDGVEIGPLDWFHDGGNPGTFAQVLDDLPLSRDQVRRIFLQAEGERTGAVSTWLPFVLDIRAQPWLESVDITFDEFATQLVATAVGGAHCQSGRFEFSNDNFATIAASQDVALIDGEVAQATKAIAASDRSTTWSVRVTPFNAPLQAGLQGVAQQASVFVPPESTTPVAEPEMFLGYSWIIVAGGFEDPDRSLDIQLEYPAGTQSLKISYGDIADPAPEPLIEGNYTFDTTEPGPFTIVERAKKSDGVNDQVWPSAIGRPDVLLTIRAFDGLGGTGIELSSDSVVISHAVRSTVQQVAVGGTSRSELTSGALVRGAGTSPVAFLVGDVAGRLARWDGAKFEPDTGPVVIGVDPGGGDQFRVGGAVLAHAGKFQGASPSAIPLFVRAAEGQSALVARWNDNADNPLFRVDPVGQLALGPDVQFAFGSRLRARYDNPAAADTHLSYFELHQTVAADLHTVSAVAATARSEHPSGHVTTVTGVQGVAQHVGAGTVGSLRAFDARPVGDGTGEVADAVGFHANEPGTSNCVNAYCFKSQPITLGTNRYGLWLDNVAGGGGTNEAIRTHAGEVSFGDRVVIRSGGLVVGTDPGGTDLVRVGGAVKAHAGKFEGTAAGAIPLFVVGAPSQSAHLVRVNDNAGNPRFIVTPGAQVRIGHDSAATGSPPLDILGTDGAIVAAQTLADLADKNGTFAVRHRTNAEEPLLAIRAASVTNFNTVQVGGGDSNFNAATDIIFYTGATPTTLGGTERMRITSGGAVTISNVGSVTLKLEADTNNVGEADLPEIIFSQDGGARAFRIGGLDGNGFSIAPVGAGFSDQDIFITPGDNASLHLAGAATGANIILGGSGAASFPNIIRMRVGTTNVLFLDDGEMAPGVDNSQLLGTSGLRWTAVWAVDGSINTSDPAQKIIHGDIEPAAALAVVSKTRIYRYENAERVGEGRNLVGASIHDLPDWMRYQGEGISPYSMASVAWAAIAGLSGMVEKLDKRLSVLEV